MHEGGRDLSKTDLGKRGGGRGNRVFAEDRDERQRDCQLGRRTRLKEVEKAVLSWQKRLGFPFDRTKRNPTSCGVPNGNRKGGEF